ncbi:MAG: TRAP transporter small permease [Deltaproteobacteria bacterium]|nr:TRAP transporter small permease [Deltaproteobacteria bacterium]
MERFANIVRRISLIGTAAGGVCLIMMMLVIVANVIFRLLGGNVVGSYEMSELLIVVAVAFALGYAALEESHVDVDIVVSRFSQRWQNILKVFTSFLAMGTWALIAWATTIILSERWLTEVSEMLLIPFLPFRFVLMFGLILITLIYLLNMVTALRKVVMK